MRIHIDFGWYKAETPEVSFMLLRKYNDSVELCYIRLWKFVAGINIEW